MKEETVYIKTEFIKLDSLLKFSGAVMTGGEAKNLIEQGEVLYNGQPCTQRGKKCRHGDAVQACGLLIKVLREENAQCS